MKVLLPFSGFYGTRHDAMLDDALERVFEELPASLASNLQMRAIGECEWTRVYHDYATEYAKRFFQEYLDLELVGEVELSCPREYNFETDKIIVEVDDLVMVMLHDLAMDRGLAELVKEELTPRSGFIPFHSSNVEDWGPLETWTEAQAQLILQVMAGADFDHSAEAELMESASGNGLIDNWLYSHCPNLNFYADLAQDGIDVVLDTASAQRGMTDSTLDQSARFVRFGNCFIMVIDACSSHERPGVEEAAEIAIDWMQECDPEADITDYVVV